MGDGNRSAAMKADVGWMQTTDRSGLTALRIGPDERVTGPKGEGEEIIVEVGREKEVGEERGRIKTGQGRTSSTIN